MVAALVVVVLGAGAVLAWRLTTATPTATATERTVDVSTETIKDTVGATGTVEPLHRADLTFTSSGTVSDVTVAVGDKVTKNQVLARIDDDALQADLDAAKADYQAARDDLTSAQDSSTTTEAELNAAESKVSVQKSKLTQAEEALDAAVLRSPITGTVALVDLAEGDSVGSGSGTSTTNTTSSSAGITVISSNSYTVTTSVGSADLTKIKKGLQAEITPTGATAPIYGTVSSVAVMASETGTSGGTGTSTSSGSSATFDVSIAVTGKQKSLYAGATAAVSIIASQRADVLTVPTAAVRTADGKTVVDKLVDGQKVATPIGVGESYGAVTEVTEGLATGDQVVVTATGRGAGGTGGRTGTGSGGNQGAPGGGAGGFPAGGVPGGAGAGQQGGSR